ncbi:Carbamoyl-phosphate synthase [Mycena indigotica]|uniref:Carbamoyl-phosphate synthase n=1 Tax=Mycena indigotica TaxID=2126181 RepID=A0A8H6SXU2_9AGAR|nr:Carbamoyl-phosphate synthase [Mycena indigotica]KAF7307268.1 Carbamoyl-phosphate synthase [Mycena indigotica]
MEDRFRMLQASIQDALDDLSSPRSSNESRLDALRTLERLLATSFVPERSTEDTEYFLALQYTFECNVASRILSWTVGNISKIDALTTRGVPEENELEVALLTTQLQLAMSILQGVCLTHPASKFYLGRKYSLEVLLDLFLASRHLASAPSSSRSPVKPSAAPPPLASVILDTLLCILVDSSPALRVFESCEGPQAVVKILKRAATPSEVRMKCVEFLYFYLLDETTPSRPTATPNPATPKPQAVVTAPSTPAASNPLNKKPFINATPARPLSLYGSSTYSLTSSAFASSDDSNEPSSSSASSSRSTSGSSASSFSSTSSNAGSTSPKKHTQMLPGLGTPRHPSSRPLLMLRKDLDFVPLSPKKAPGESPRNIATPMRRTHTRTRSRLASTSSTSSEEGTAGAPIEDRSRTSSASSGAETIREDDGSRAKTTEEKKRLLSTMLGNVEALVEGVRKAGIWGLG